MADDATREDLVQQAKAEQRPKPAARRAPKPVGAAAAPQAMGPVAAEDVQEGASSDAPKKRRRRRRKPGGDGGALAGQD